MLAGTRRPYVIGHGYIFLTKKWPSYIRRLMRLTVVEVRREPGRLREMTLWPVRVWDCGWRCAAKVSREARNTTITGSYGGGCHSTRHFPTIEIGFQLTNQGRTTRLTIRGPLRGMLRDFELLRNRIAHHEPIYTLSPSHHVANIETLAGLIEDRLTQYIRHCSHVPGVVADYESYVCGSTREESP